MVSFESALTGRFENMLTWERLDGLWDAVNSSKQDWYIYEVGMDVPIAPLNGNNLKQEIRRIDTLLHENHKYDYCGIVYVDSETKPTLIKVYGPKNLGASCGSSGSKTWPRWIISRIKPTAVGIALDTNRKPKWWQSFSFKRGG